MSRVTTAVIGVFVGIALVGAAALLYVVVTGLSARGTPGSFEAWLATSVRQLAIPRDVRTRVNPLAGDPASRRRGMVHWADHCASCHGNDGRGATELGEGFFPPAPDMRGPSTQQLTDGELFYIIENGVRFTGMPAWSTGTAEGEVASWELVSFVRHLPSLTDAELEEMIELNPKSADQRRQEEEAREFLEGSRND